jgi:probable HAF family extracellular repeat protein
MEEHMKTIVTSIAAASLFAAFALAQPPHYTVTDLGVVGATPGQPFFVAPNGLIGGAAAAPDGAMDAMLWYKKLKMDIAKPGLGGANSVAFSVNAAGQAVGEAETSALDPKGEDFCGFQTLGLPSAGNSCLPFLWHNGAMTALPTLGGNNGAVNQINKNGEMAGLAEGATPDPGCTAPQVLQFKPVVWINDKIHELVTLDGDLDGAAFAINDNGQVAGASGQCSPFNPSILENLQPLHALLWERGTVIDLGNLGGTGLGFGNLALNLNNQGQVVGQSDLPGDANFHAFLWTKDAGIGDLGTLTGDVNSVALGINDSGEIVGLSLDANFDPHPYFWQGGVMTSLNSLIPADSPLSLLIACSINSNGEIVGLAVTSTGEVHGYLATPSNTAVGSEVSSPAAQRVTGAEALSDHDRQLLVLRLGRRGL